MKIAVLGLTGVMGHKLANQGIQRGHTFLGVSPHAEDCKDLPEGVILKNGRGGDRVIVSGVIRGYDIVVSLFPPDLLAPERFAQDMQNLIDAVKCAGVPRLITILGGSASDLPHGKSIFDYPFRNFWQQQTVLHYYENIRTAIPVYQAEMDLDWVIMIPSGRMSKGDPKRGNYRYRDDGVPVVFDEHSQDMLTNSGISYDDFVLAILDEVENHRFTHKRVCIGW